MKVETDAVFGNILENVWKVGNLTTAIL